jgi:hypothetical protein
LRGCSLWNVGHPGANRSNLEIIKKGRTPILPDSPPSPDKPRRRSPDVPVREILDWVGRWKVALAIGVGIGFRLACFFSRTGFWMDETSLLANIETLTPIEMFGPLLNQQLAAPGFLVATWCSVQLFGDNAFGMRLIPLLGGIGGLFLFVAVARRCLSPWVVFPALVMFVTSNDLIYYASEIKQYSTDVASTLAGLLLGLTVGSRRLSVATAAGLAAFGASIVWFSHPSIFVLASVGVVGLIRAIAAKDWRWAGLWLVVGMAWLVSFAGVHAVATRQLAGSDQMWRFWGFAFPPMPPKSFWDATWLFRRLAYYFINPLNFDVPFGPRLSMLPAFGLAVVGVVRLGKVDRYRLALLVLPVAATLAASSFRLYPFHGRLVLFLAPIPLIAIAAGLDAVREVRGRGLIYYALALMVLAFPAAVAIEQAFEPRWFHNHLGDLRPAKLDPDRFPL